MPAGAEPSSNDPKLYEVSLESGEYTLRKAEKVTPKLSSDDRVKTNACFVVVHGRSAFIWMSKNVKYDYKSFNQAMESVKGDIA